MRTGDYVRITAKNRRVAWESEILGFQNYEREEFPIITVIDIFGNTKFVSTRTFDIEVLEPWKQPEPAEIGTVYQDCRGVRWTKYTNDIYTMKKWVCEDGTFISWNDLLDKM